MIDSEVRNMNQLLGKSISRKVRSQFIIQHCLCINIGVAHNEVCKWLIKNGPPMNFAERESDQLFLHQERKSAKYYYYAESWVSFDKYFQLIAICGQAD